MKKVIPTILLMTACVTLFLKCGEDEKEEAAKFSNLYSKVFEPECSQCHVPTGNVYVDSKVLIDMSSKSTAYESLTSKISSADGSSAVCAGIKYVESKDPDKSYLAAVLFSDYAKKGFGGKAECVPYNLHHTDISLKDDQKEAIIKWIKDGAKDN